PHVGNQRVVTKRDAAFGNKHVGLPGPGNLAAALGKSQGARNWPFLTLIAPPAVGTGATGSGCRQGNAGIWKMSTTPAAAAHACGSCRSVRTATPSWSRKSAKIVSALSRPKPRALAALVRFALSNEVL